MFVTFHCVASDKEPIFTYEKKKAEVAKELGPAPLRDAAESERWIKELLRAGRSCAGLCRKAAEVGFK